MARACTAGTEGNLNRGRRERGVGHSACRAISAVAGPLNINDVGFFAPLNSRIWRENFEAIDDLVTGSSDVVLRVQYNLKTLEKVWQTLFQRYN